MISTKGRYSIRILLDLAEHRNGSYIPMKDVAARQNISLKYIERLMPALKAAGLVDSVHGIGGGYRLTREPDQYTLWEILRLADAFIRGNRDRYPKTIRATRAKGCRVRLAHAASRQAQYRYLLAQAGERRAPFAVLYRNNDSALPLIDALERAGLPYRCRSFDDTFFTHRIVSDVQDILRFAAAPDDAERFLRIYYKFGALISKEAAQAACVQSARTHAPILDCLLAQTGRTRPARKGGP